MLRMLRFGALLSSFCIVAPLLAAEKGAEDPKVRNKLLQKDYLEGKLKDVMGDGEDRTYTVVVAEKATVVNKVVETKINDLNKKLLDQERNAGPRPNQTTINNIR